MAKSAVQNSLTQNMFNKNFGKLTLKKYNYRFAEQVLNSNLHLKQEIEDILTDPTIDIISLSRKQFNKELDNRFVAKGWRRQPYIFDNDINKTNLNKKERDPSPKMDFLKDRIGMEVAFTHSSFIGIDLLKFQIASYSGLDKIDMGIYVVTTRNFQKKMSDIGLTWDDGSLTYEKVITYLPHFKSAIQVPIYVYGIDI